MKSKIYVSFTAAAIIASVFMMPVTVPASHSWGTYHWARTTSSFTLKVVDSNTAGWQSMYAAALSDWSQSSKLDMTAVAGDESTRTRKRCPMVSGQVRSCNAEYGFNGWLGLASINIQGSHITQGTSKMNDSYFNSPSYNNTARRHVMCQELGHTIGLGHQDESGADLNTCMDYARALDNPSPNNHDYQQLETIYNHLDTTTTVGFAAFGSQRGVDVTDDPSSWGRLVAQSANGRSSTYIRDNWDGSRTVTHVFWTAEWAERCRSCDHRFDH